MTTSSTQKTFRHEVSSISSEKYVSEFQENLEEMFPPYYMYTCSPLYYMYTCILLKYSTCLSRIKQSNEYFNIHETFIYTKTSE